MAIDFDRYINDDLEAFEEDYLEIAGKEHTLPARKFHKQEIGELWSIIEKKYEQHRESPDVASAELAAGAINMSEIDRKMRSARKTRRTYMISFTQPIQPEHQITQLSDLESLNVSHIDMPNFNGDFKQWPSLRDLFQAIYGNNIRLSAVEKLFHLKNKTSGEAKEIVDSVPLTNELATQFENRRMQINAPLKTLLCLLMVNTI